jgi:cardiolipin synthase
MNFDNRSVAFNDESNLVFLDSTLGQEMESIYLNDLALSREILLPEFEKRAAWQKAIEMLASTLQRIL